jgi:aminoglycoside phosphotransferase (APT) family kinase protein
LTAFLPVPTRAPIGRGLPSADFPWAWSIFTWFEGKPAEFGQVEDQAAFASDLAKVLTALHHVDSTGGRANFLLPGGHSGP